VVNGDVRLKLYKGNCMVVGRRSTTDSLFDPSIATFEEDAGAYPIFDRFDRRPAPAPRFSEAVGRAVQARSNT